MHAPIRVLLLNGEYPPFAGGGGVYTYLLAKGLAKHWKDTQVIVYAGTSDPALDKKLERIQSTPADPSANRIIYYSKTLWDLDHGGSAFLSVVQDFEEVIKLFEPTLIHAHHTMECLLAGMVAAKHSIPFVMTIQKSPVPDDRDLAKPSWTAIQFCYRHVPCDGVIATSDVYARQAKQLGAPEPLVRIYYGIDLKQFRPDPATREESRRSLGISDETILVLCPSRIDDRKGIDVLIDATRSVVEAVPDLRVIVAGRRGPEVEQWYQFLAGLVRGYGLGNVVSLGASENSFESMARLYAAADICALPSLREGLGLSVIEAMATGVPVVTTRTTGVDELITDGENGFMVPVNDSAALAQSIIALATSSELRISISRNALTFAATKGFDYNAMAKDHIAFYTEVLRRRSS